MFALWLDSTAADACDVPRPFEFELVANVEDGCDTGAFKAVDADGDGYSEAADCDSSCG